MTGNYSYEAKASPLLYNMLYEVTKAIDVDINESVFDRWVKSDPEEDKTLPK